MYTRHLSGLAGVGERVFFSVASTQILLDSSEVSPLPRQAHLPLTTP